MNIDPFMVAVGIINNQELTDELLNKVMGMLPKINPDLDPQALDQVRKRLESTIGISIQAGRGLHGEGQEPWLDDRKAAINWNYWNSYKLQLKSGGFSNDVVRVLDEDTDNILNECGYPGSESGWRVQGLVMGDVQSGKTANYCGLINKASDAGYKFIVLLTGMIEELRAQTQERMDSGFVGVESKNILEGERDRTPIGSGRFRTIFPNVLTSIERDFLTKNKDALGGIPLQNIKEPVLLVMKKNSSPLKNLITYLDSQLMGGQKQLSLPLLLVDDEADNASVNAKKDEDPAKINRLIREVIKRFDKSTYVAYTATPFANVFINPDMDDLFPSNFVYSLNSPTNYIGVKGVFTESGPHHYQVMDINDADAVFPYKHKKELPIESLPRSLEEALEAFLLSCAIRDIRREPLRHRSMLVNVTRFTSVQERLVGMVKRYLYELTEDVKQYLADDDLWRKHSRLVTLHDTWKSIYSDCELSWDGVRKNLYESIASIKVVMINQRSEVSDKLNYGAFKDTEKGRRVIAIGGLTLSRGLTLEGLCISYFYRNSKAYDTLLQMGRWFGYRQGYEDLCRIWMDPDVQDWFDHVAEVIDELKFDIRRMHTNRQPPIKFGMRVRSHPDTLIVTALNKMRNSKEIEIAVSYSECGAETAFIPRSRAENEKNLELVERFIEGLGTASMIGNRCVWRGVKASRISNFLGDLKISNMNMQFISDFSGHHRPIISFVGENKFKELDEWDVCLPQGDALASAKLKIDMGNGIPTPIKPRKRQFERVEGTDYLKLNKQRVGEISDETVGLSDESLRSAKLDWENYAEENKGKSIPGSFYRKYRQRPLLTIHIIQPQDPNPDSKRAARMMKAQEIELSEMVAVGLSFPRFGGKDNEEDMVSYQLNKVALRTMGLISDSDEEDEDED